MNSPHYSPPVDKLLTYGDCLESINSWPEYPQELGLGADHIPDLIRMVADPALRLAESEQLEVWAPIHAWRALGQLQAEAAIEPLIGLLSDAEEDDWIKEELPEVFGLIGPAAIPALTTFLQDKSQDVYSRATANDSLETIAQHHPEVRDQCVAAITQELASFADNEPDLNGFLVCSLIELQAVESAPVIEQAFAAKQVDLMFAGDWDAVQVELGLKSRDELPQRAPEFHLNLTDPAYSTRDLLAATVDDQGSKSFRGFSSTHKDKNKAKQKMVKESRKQNRTKKKRK